MTVIDLSLLGERTVTDDGLVVENPATGELIASVPNLSAEDVLTVIEQAHQAMPDWANRAAKERCSILRRWNDLVLDHREKLAAIMTAECGKPLIESLGEVAYGASFIEWFAEESKRIYGDTIPHHADGKRILVIRQPVGVSASITPWNFPLAMITRKASPALAAGCPMVVKPAEATPLTALALEQLAREAGIPPAIFRVVTTKDPASIGEVMCKSDLVRKFSFTGSTRVGKLLAAKCTSTVKKVSLELGGNAPFIVFDDADLESAVDGAIASKYRNAGQTCVCANRFLVQRGIHDAFVEALTDRVSRMKVGNGAEPDVTIGPLINTSSGDKVNKLVSEAVASGAKVEIGGHNIDAVGTFYAPTILTGVSSNMAIANEEIFGPVAPIICFENEQEAIGIANDTPYGLAAYFYSRDLGRVWRVMERLEYGMVGANEGIISTEVAPFGGIKESGIGREGSRYGIEEYTELKYCLVGGIT